MDIMSRLMCQRLCAEPPYACVHAAVRTAERTWEQVITAL